MNTTTSHSNSNLPQYDKLVLMILLAHIPVVMFLVPMGYGTSTFAIAGSMALGVLTAIAYTLTRGTPAFGIIAGVLLMGFSAVMIQAQLGRLEMHFHIFSALAILLIYRNWLTIAVPAGVIAVHHLAFTLMQLNNVSIGGIPIQAFAVNCSWSITFVHAGFVVFESAILIYFSMILRHEEKTALELINAVQKVQNERDLTTRINSSKQDSITSELNSLLENFDSLTSDIAKVAENINQTAEGLDLSTKESQQTLSAQNDKTIAVVEAMDDMSRSIEKVTSHIQEVAAAASNTNEHVDIASDKVSSSMRLSKELETSMSQTSDSIIQLAKSVESIGSVVGVIRGISEQTNLLALNAAIEAARAGESGRGFAVVADEVRTLAERTQSSTTEIQEIIETLQNVTQDAVSNIDHGQTITQQSVEGITVTNDALKMVFDAVQNINDMNIELTKMAQQQNITAESVNSNIHTIAELGKESTSKVAGNQENVSTLNDITQSLTLRIQQYKYS